MKSSLGWRVSSFFDHRQQSRLLSTNSHQHCIEIFRLNLRLENKMLQGTETVVNSLVLLYSTITIYPQTHTWVIFGEGLKASSATIMTEVINIIISMSRQTLLLWCVCLLLTTIRWSFQVMDIPPWSFVITTEECFKQRELLSLIRHIQHARNRYVVKMDSCIHFIPKWKRI